MFLLNLISLNISKLTLFKSNTISLKSIFSNASKLTISQTHQFSIYLNYLLLIHLFIFHDKFNVPFKPNLSKYFKTDTLQIQHYFSKVNLLKCLTIGNFSDINISILNLISLNIPKH